MYSQGRLNDCMFVKGRREKDLEMSLKHCIFSCFLVVLFAISYNEGNSFCIFL